jgi:uncharacterized membrane protein
MKQIIFTDKNAKELYLDYINRVELVTKILSEEDRQDILMELNSHIYEYLRQNATVADIDNITAILKRLGTPEETLKGLVADRKMKQATKSFNPFHLFKALSLNITKGISYAVFSILYLFIACFSVLIFAKLLFSKNVGLFLDETGLVAIGMVKSKVSGNPAVYEVLGWWFIPLTIMAVICLYLMTTFILRAIYKLKK